MRTTTTKLSPAAKAFRKVKKLTVSHYKKKLDAIFSEYIRRRDDGQCFTCPTKREWKLMQNGHFVSRSHNATRYDEENCNCQCPGCNVFKHGNMVIYAMNMSKKYGTDIMERLERKSREEKHFTVSELQELIETYRSKLKEMES